MKKRQAKGKECLIFFLKDFFKTVLNTAVLGSEIVSSAIHATIDESPVFKSVWISWGNHYRKSAKKSSLKKGFELRRGDHLTYKALGEGGRL